MTLRHAVRYLGVFAILSSRTFLFAQTPDVQLQIQQLEERLQQLEREREPAPGALRVELETAQLQLYYAAAGARRQYLLVRLLWVNNTSKTLRIPPDAVALLLDAETRTTEPPSRSIEGFSVEYQGERVDLKSLRANRPVTALPSGATGAWYAFEKLPAAARLPSLKVRVRADGMEQVLDLNTLMAARLGLTSERIGPRGCVALVTISGQLHALNAQVLVDRLNELATQQLVRVVIRFGKDAALPDSSLIKWLTHAALADPEAARQVSDQLPLFPPQFREVHVASLPGRGPTEVLSEARRHLHDTDAAAVAAAMQDVFASLGSAELLQSIRQGNELARAAALVAATGRLPESELPAIEQWIHDDAPLMQSAAIAALAGFHRDDTVARLRALAEKQDAVRSPAAVRALIASRFPAARAALEAVFRASGPAEQARIVIELARRPRPLWTNLLLEYAQTQSHPAVADALRSLNVLDHPELNALLGRLLRHGEGVVRETAFQLLAQRTDEASERLIVEEALARLEKSPPEPAVREILTRLKPLAAVPLLLKHIDVGVQRNDCLHLLGVIGDLPAAEELAKRYPRLKPAEQAQALSSLQMIQWPRLVVLARAALISADATLGNAAADVLMKDRSDAAGMALVQALEEPTTPEQFTRICRALGEFPPRISKAALEKHRSTPDATRRAAVNQALARLRQNSPGYVFVLAARDPAESQHWRMAEELYTTATEADPDLAEAWAGRAHVRMQLETYAVAEADFLRSLELDPHNSVGHTGIAICEVLRGEIDAGLARLEAQRPQFLEDVNFHYNAACGYARAYEKLTAKEVSEEEAAQQKALCQRYFEQSLADLESSLKIGQLDVPWMLVDPDLAAVRDSAEFQALLKKLPAQP